MRNVLLALSSGWILGCSAGDKGVGNPATEDTDTDTNVDTDTDTDTDTATDTADTDTGTRVTETITLSWSATGAAPAREFRYASISPHDPHTVFLGSARSGHFGVNTLPPTFLRIPIGRHFYTPLLVAPTDSNKLMVSGGKFFWYTEDVYGPEWEKRWPGWPETDASVWSDANTVTGLVANDERVVLSDNEGRVWVSTDLSETWTHVGTVPGPEDDGSKHGGEDDLAFWTVAGTTPLLLDDDQMLLAWDNGSVFRSEDGGMEWVEVLTGSANRHALARVGDKVVVGTEDGLYVSMDAGRTFTLDSDAPDHCVYASMVAHKMALVCDGELWMFQDGEYVRRTLSSSVESVAIAPSTASVVVAGLLEGMAWSTDGGETFETTTDGLHVSDLYVVSPDPEDSDVLLAGTACTAGVYRTEDRGDTWTAVPSSAHYTMLIRHAPSNPARVYMTNSSVPNLGDLQRSDDGGESFETIAVPDGDVSHPHALAIHPYDHEYIVIGSSNDDLGHSEHKPTLYRSEDGGETWDELGLELPESMGALISAVFSPTDPMVILVGTGPGGTDHASFEDVGDEAEGDGQGLWISRDGGETFSSGDVGVEGNNVWDVAASPDGELFVGTDQGVFLSTDNAASFTQILPLEDAQRVNLGFTPSHPNWVAVSSFEGFWLSTDGGSTFASYWEEAVAAIDPRPFWDGVFEVAFSSDGETLYLTTDSEFLWRADVEVTRD